MLLNNWAVYLCPMLLFVLLRRTCSKFLPIIFVAIRWTLEFSLPFSNFRSCEPGLDLEHFLPLGKTRGIVIIIFGECLKFLWGAQPLHPPPQKIRLWCELNFYMNDGYVLYTWQSFPLSDYDDIYNGWKDKLVRVGDGTGEQRWGLFTAEK